MAQRVRGDVLLPDRALAHQLGDEGMVLRHLLQGAVTMQVGAAVAGVNEAHLRPEVKRHGDGGAHALQGRVGGCLLRDLRIGVLDRALELFQHLLRAGMVRLEEPPEGVEREVLDGRDRDGTSALAGLVSAHAVGHQVQVRAFLAPLYFRLGQARLADPHGLAELGDQELIFVALAHQAAVGEAERPGGQAGRQLDGGGFVTHKPAHLHEISHVTP